MAERERKELLIPFLYFIGDIIAIEVAFLVSYYLRFSTPLYYSFHNITNTPEIYPYLLGSLIVIPIWVIIFNARKMYEPRRTAFLSEELISIIKSITLGMFFVLSVAFFYRDFSYSRAVFILIYFNSIIFVFIFRFLLSKFEKLLYRSGKEIKNLIIIGSNDKAQRIYRNLSRSTEQGLKVIGYCDKNIFDSADFKFICAPEALRNSIIEHNISIVLIILPVERHGELISIYRACEGINVEFMYMPDILEALKKKVRIKLINGLPFLHLKEIPLSGWNYFVKRAFDIIFSLIFLILSLPISIPIIILIKLESRGPLFYLQDRVGLEGKIFKVMKFRSMRIDAETKTGPVWAKEGDNRTTKIGKFIRRFSLDEFPQFINVLKGDMSIVGPRPERPYFVDKFKEEIPQYLERHRVKTGITGWAQVNGLRGNTPLEDRVEYDIYYIENWSLLFDIVIIIKTFKEMFFSKNAY